MPIMRRAASSTLPDCVPAPVALAALSDGLPVLALATQRSSTRMGGRQRGRRTEDDKLLADRCLWILAATSTMRLTDELETLWLAGVLTLGFFTIAQSNIWELEETWPNDTREIDQQILFLILNDSIEMTDLPLFKNKI
jgi:hypothetical protein